MSLTFDPETHTYRLRGKVVPSVTQVLQPLRTDLRAVNAGALRAAGERGTAVHLAIELDLLRDLYEEGLDSRTAACLSQWRRFLKVSGFVVRESEKRVYPVSGTYAGTADIFGELNDCAAVLDIKTCAPHWTHALQLAAYCKAERSHGRHPAMRRLSLHLTPDTFVLKQYANVNDFLAWDAAYTLWHWRSMQ